MRAARGKVIVKCSYAPVKKFGSIWAVSSTDLQSFNELDPRHGTVIGGARDGQTALFEYGVYNHCRKGFGQILEQDDENVTLIFEESFIRCYLNNGVIEMVDGYVLCAPKEDTEYTDVGGVKIKARKEGLLYIPSLREDHHSQRAMLRHINESDSKKSGLKAGMEVYMDRACDIFLEGTERILDQPYFIVELKYIIGWI